MRIEDKHELLVTRNELHEDKLSFKKLLNIFCVMVLCGMWYPETWEIHVCWNALP